MELAHDNNEGFLAAASVVPPFRSVTYWYECWRNENFGDRGGQQMWAVLDAKKCEYEEKGAVISISQEKGVIVMATQIMQRAHELSSSSEIVFVDSTSSVDDGHNVVTFLFAKCAVGAVPLGVIITAGASEQNYYDGFLALRDLLGDAAFGGQKFPAFFMTDDSDAEHNALRRVWPSAAGLLCLFHILQAVWRWLWKAENTIAHSDRPLLMKQFRRIVYAMTPDVAQQCFQMAIVSDIGSRYPHWIRYLGKYWDRRERWCLAYRKSVALRGCHTNNYVETAIRLFKDIVLSRAKAFNAVSLLDFIASVMDKYYERRLRQFASSRDPKQHLLLSQVLAKAAHIPEGDIEDLSDGFYSVKSQTQADEYYFIDAESGACSCPVGCYGAFCKHQAALFRHKRIHLPSVPAISNRSRYEMAVLARGAGAREPEYYRGLDENMGDGIGTDAPMLICSPTAPSGDVTEAQGHPVSNADQELPNETAASGESVVNVNELAEKVASDLEQMVKKYSSDPSVVVGAETFFKRLSKIKSASQFATFLHTAGSSLGIIRRAGAAIRVQPTSIQRRRPGVTRGCKKLGYGRPPSSNPPPAKRRCRNLALNISKNQPNAKGHGR